MDASLVDLQAFPFDLACLSGEYQIHRILVIPKSVIVYMYLPISYKYRHLIYCVVKYTNVVIHATRILLNIYFLLMKV